MNAMTQSGLFNTQKTSVTVNNNDIKQISSFSISNNTLNFDTTMCLSLSKELIKDSFNITSEMRLAIEKLIRDHSIVNNHKQIKKSFQTYYSKTVEIADFYSKYKNIFKCDDILSEKIISVISNIDVITSSIIKNDIESSNSNKKQYNIEFDELLLACSDLEIYFISLHKKT